MTRVSVAVLLLIASASGAGAYVPPDMVVYVNCLREQARKLDDRVSDARTIAASAVTACKAVRRDYLLVTLADAGRYIAALPAAEQRLAHWQTAAEILLLVAERDGDPMMARIGVVRALNHGQPAPPSEPRRKRAKVYKLIR